LLHPKTLCKTCNHRKKLIACKLYFSFLMSVQATTLFSFMPINLGFSFLFYAGHLTGFLSKLKFRYLGITKYAFCRYRESRDILHGLKKVSGHSGYAPIFTYTPISPRCYAAYRYYSICTCINMLLDRACNRHLGYPDAWLLYLAIIVPISISMLKFTDL
jgi:hypothetical protein